MNRNDVINLCTSLPGAFEDYPFGDEVAVYKVGGKLFALVRLSSDPGVLTLKCDPEKALELRAQYPAVQPGYHTNKRHWNTVTLDGSVNPDDLHDMITHSYDLVVAGLPKLVRDNLDSR